MDLPHKNSEEPVLPAPVIKGSALSNKFEFLGAMCQIQSIYSSPRLTRKPPFIETDTLPGG